MARQKLELFPQPVTVERTSVMSGETNNHAASRHQSAILAPAIGASGRNRASKASVDEVRYFP
jgi:hypothetical protein